MPRIEVPAPMSGSIKEILVQTGAQVSEGEELIIIESMKMEIPIEAPAAGTVAEIRITAPQTIEEGQLLLTIEAE